MLTSYLFYHEFFLFPFLHGEMVYLQTIDKNILKQLLTCDDEFLSGLLKQDVAAPLIHIMLVPACNLKINLYVVDDKFL